MPLQAALATFRSEMTKIYSSNEGSSKEQAEKTAKAIYSWVTQGVPQIIHNPALKGEGGIDGVGGMGLEAAKEQFATDLEKGFKSRSNTAAQAAKVLTDAYLAFLLEAKVMTTVTAVVGSAGAPYKGTGLGGIESATPGVGLSVALDSYAADLEKLYSTNSGSNTVRDFARRLAAVSQAFLLQAKVVTEDAGVAGSGGASTAGKIL